MIGVTFAFGMKSSTFTATVTGSNPTGNVSFTENNVALANCASVALTGTEWTNDKLAQEGITRFRYYLTGLPGGADDSVSEFLEVRNTSDGPTVNGGRFGRDCIEPRSLARPVPVGALPHLSNPFATAAGLPT